MTDRFWPMAALRERQLWVESGQSVSERYAIFLYHAHRPDTPRQVHSFIEHAALHIEQKANSFRLDEKQLAALHLRYLNERQPQRLARHSFKPSSP
jgi:hypothetical protein